MVGKSYMQEFGETYHTHSVLTDRCLSEIDLVFYHGFIHMYVYTVKPVLRGHSWDRPRKSGLIRQMTSEKRFNSHEIYYDDWQE
jgi:hypothetical protein